MFVRWLELQPNATWSQLIIALGIIGMRSAAEDVIKCLLKGLYNNNCTSTKLMRLFVFNWLMYVCVTSFLKLLLFVKAVQGRSRRSGWSGFGRTTISQGKNKVPFYKKQVINKSSRVIFGLVQLVILR